MDNLSSSLGVRFSASLLNALVEKNIKLASWERIALRAESKVIELEQQNAELLRQNQKLKLMAKHLLAAQPVNKSVYTTKISEPLNSELEKQVEDFAQINTEIRA